MSAEALPPQAYELDRYEVDKLIGVADSLYDEVERSIIAKSFHHARSFHPHNLVTEMDKDHGSVTFHRGSIGSGQSLMVYLPSRAITPLEEDVLIRITFLDKSRGRDVSMYSADKVYKQVSLSYFEPIRYKDPSDLRLVESLICDRQYTPRELGLRMTETLESITPEVISMTQRLSPKPNQWMGWLLSHT